MTFIAIVEKTKVERAVAVDIHHIFDFDTSQDGNGKNHTMKIGIDEHRDY